jgi:hypothetical protein
MNTNSASRVFGSIAARLFNTAVLVGLGAVAVTLVAQ